MALSYMYLSGVTTAHFTQLQFNVCINHCHGNRIYTLYNSYITAKIGILADITLGQCDVADIPVSAVI